MEKAKVVKNEVRAQLNQRSIRYNWHEPDVTALEGFLARGDRRCADVILKAYEKGALYDAWTENFDYDIWKEAMAECGVDMTFYTLREEAWMRSFHGISLIPVSAADSWSVNGSVQKRVL